MQILSEEDYLALRAGAELIEVDRHGDKVLRLADGDFLKLFRLKRLLSSAAWYPYAQRFADNAAGLQQRGVPCPEVEAVYRIPSIQRDAVKYKPLQGRTLRELIAAGEDPPDLRRKLAAFVSSLQAAGIYFRSLHLGNILLTPGGELGLIDIADMSIGERPLGAYRRWRHWRRLRRDPKDRRWMNALE